MRPALLFVGFFTLVVVAVCIEKRRVLHWLQLARIPHEDHPPEAPKWAGRILQDLSQALLNAPQETLAHHAEFIDDEIANVLEVLFPKDLSFVLGEIAHGFEEGDG